MSFTTIPNHIWEKYLPQEILCKMVVNKSTRELGKLARDKEIDEVKKLSQGEMEKLVFTNLIKRKLEYVLLLLDPRIDINIHMVNKHFISGYGYGYGDGDGGTPLHYASEEGHMKIVKLLLERGADIEAKNIHKWTPLHFASYKERTEVVKLLLERGADIEAKNIHKWTPLHFASYKERTEVIKLLLERGAEVDAKDIYCKTPLRKTSNVKIVKLLLENGADVNMKDKDGRTPLHGASHEGHTGIVKLLLENGADVNMKGNYGYTPLHIASFFGRTEVVRLLSKDNCMWIFKKGKNKGFFCSVKPKNGEFCSKHKR